MSEIERVFQECRDKEHEFTRCRTEAWRNGYACCLEVMRRAIETQAPPAAAEQDASYSRASFLDLLKERDRLLSALDQERSYARDARRYRQIFTSERIFIGIVEQENWPDRPYFFTRMSKDDADKVLDAAMKEAGK